MQAFPPADTPFMQHNPRPVIRRTAAAVTLLLGAAAFANRNGADTRPFLLMALALVPQGVSLALTLVRAERESWIRPDAMTSWLLRGLAALALIPGLVEVRLLSASLVASIALGVASWPQLLIVVKPEK